MNWKTLMVGALVLCSYQLHAQKNHFESGELAFQNEKYVSALESYKKAEATQKKPELKGAINFKIALCYAQLLDIEQAEVYLERAKRLKYTSKEPQLLFCIADVLMQQGNYKESKVLFQEYLSLIPQDSLASSKMHSCETAPSKISNPTPHTVQAEVQINSMNYEYAPAFADKRFETIFFGSTRTGSTGNALDDRTGESFSDIWSTVRDAKGKWGEPQLLPSEINTGDNEGTPTLNTKKDALYFTRCNVVPKKNLGCDIYYSERKGNGWSEASKIVLKPDGADSLSVGHPALNAKEDVLIFSSDLPGGLGGKDLWYSTYDKKLKTWSTPVNLGSTINTSGDEVFPYLTSDNTLYFSSNGHLGLGGLDLFKAVSVDPLTWEKPKNLQYPINSSRDDFGLALENENRGLFTSNRTNGKGLDDLYSFNLQPSTASVICYVKDATTQQPIPNAKITLTGSNGELYEKVTDEQGSFSFEKQSNGEWYIHPDANYAFTATYEKYASVDSKISTYDIGYNTHKSFIEEFLLYPYDVAIDLPEVRYDYNDSALQVNNWVNSEDSLNSLYEKMIAHPGWVVELQAHTDCRGSIPYNLTLSQGRANACVEYLVGKGIEKARLVPVGYGEGVPLKGLECDSIEKLATKDEKEVAHQRNRRTQFKILSNDYISD